MIEISRDTHRFLVGKEHHFVVTPYNQVDFLPPPPFREEQMFPPTGSDWQPARQCLIERLVTTQVNLLNGPTVNLHKTKPG